MKALITVGCMTDHGGKISIGDSSYLVDGKAVHLDGMTHFCPKCKVQSKAIASNQGFMMVGSRSIVAAGDLSTCGSKFLKISDLAVMSNGSGTGSRLALSNLKPLNTEQYAKESFIGKENKSKRENNIAYYRWWWGDLESNNPETVKQEKRDSKENFKIMHKQFAYGTKPIVYEIDPKAWDAEVAFEDLPNAIQRSVDKNGDIGKALAQMSNGQSINFEWVGLGFGQDYFRSITSGEWPLGRLACIGKGKLTKLGEDESGQPNFQFVGYLEIKKDTYSWKLDNKNPIKNIGIKIMGAAVGLTEGKKLHLMFIGKQRMKCLWYIRENSILII